MKHFFESIHKALILGLLAPTLFALPLASHAQEAEDNYRGRAMALQIEAEVVNIDLEHRQVSLRGPAGEVVTMHASEKVVKLEDVKIGDKVVATYLAALEGELREPTEEELANPWVEMDKSAMSDDPDAPAIGEARIVRSVCTIEGMNRILGTVTIKDARGNLHVIGDVEPEKMEGVTLGQTIVVVYREAKALSLDKQPGSAE